MAVTLQDLKNHLRLTLDDENSVLQGYIDSSVLLFEKLTNRTLGNGEDELPWDSLIRQAVLLLSASFYLTRENDTDAPRHTLPYGFQNVVNQYRLWTVDE